MLPPVYATSGVNAHADKASPSPPREVPSPTDTMRLANAALARSKRELAEAQLQAEEQDRQISDARRELERLRWLNSSAETSPEANRVAAAAALAQNAVIDAAITAGADTNAQILRLQNRIERQTARYFDLKSNVREGEMREREESQTVSNDPDREESALEIGRREPDSVQDPTDDATEKLAAGRSEEDPSDIRDFGSLTRRAGVSRATRPGRAEAR